MNFPVNLKFKESKNIIYLYILLAKKKFHEKVNIIKELFINGNYEKVKELIELLRDDEEDNLSKLTEEEKIDLERIQYETYIKLDMYVEALENSGKFNLDNGMFLKSGKDYYNNFKEELNKRNENI